MTNVCIKLEDLVANAIIELNKSNGDNFVDMDLVMSYADAINDYFLQKKIVPISQIDCEAYDIFKNDYESYYDMDSNANKNTRIILKDDKSIEDLVFEFRCHIKPEILEAYISPEVLVSLGIEPQKEIQSTLVLK